MAKKSKKVKANKESKPKKQKVIKKEEPKKKLIIDLKTDIGLQIVNYWQNKEPDIIMDVYGTPEHSLGVSKVIYSRLPTLDKILAVKRDSDVCGIPLKMIEIFGPESCGKCVTKNNYLFNEDGLFTIEEFFNKFNKKLVNTNKIIDVKRYNIFLTNELGNNERVEKLTFNGKRKVLKVLTYRGFEIEVTENHPIRCMNKQGFIIWKNATDLNRTDYVVLKKDIFYEKIKLINKNFYAYMAGVFIADGYIGNTKITITNNDKDILRQIYGLADRLKINYKKYKANKSINIHFNGMNGGKIRKELGLDIGVAKYKKVPNWIRTNGIAAIKNFIKGYFDCECYINKSEIEITSASKQLLKEVQLMLLGLGIISTVKRKYVKKYKDNNYYRLGISGCDYNKYINIIGTNSNFRKKQINYNHKSKFDYNIIPFQKNNIQLLINDSDTDRNFPARSVIDKDTDLTNSLINKIFKYYNKRKRGKSADLILDYYKYIIDNNLFFDKIKIKKDIGKHPTFDIYMPETHSFVMNGIINHNTSFMYYLACLFASNGGVAHYIDFEHRYDPTWLSIIAHNTFGLTEEQLKRIQPIKPKHYEWFSEWIIKHMKAIIVAKDKAYNEIKELDKKKPKNYEELRASYQKVMDMPFVVLVDSVASMYTKKEIEDEEETAAHVALLSRGLSEKLKLMRRYLAYANMLIVWVNQERDDIAAARFAKGRRMLTTPGGKAIKYNCDARIRMNFIEALSRTRNNMSFKIGNITQFKIVKNLFGPPPFQTVNLKFLYDRGFFTFHSILEACVEAKIIKKVGARYRINGGPKWGEIEMEESNIDEEQLKYPGLEEVLHKVYRRKMGEVIK